MAKRKEPTTPSRRSRSVELSVIEIPVRIRKTRKCARHWESSIGLLSGISQVNGMIYPLSICFHYKIQHVREH